MQSEDWSVYQATFNLPNVIVLQVTALSNKATPATVCARIRSPYLLELLDDNVFSSWLRSRWGGHIFEEILTPLYATSELAKAGKRNTLERIYLFGVSEQFSDITEAKTMLRTWEAAAHQVTTLPLETFNGTAKLCLEWLRSRLKNGRLFAAPIQNLRIIGFTSYVKHDNDACELNDILALASCEELVGSKAALHRLTFFKVVNAFPNRRTVRHAYHLGARPTVVAIVRYSIVGHTGSSVTLKPEFHTEYLDLNYLASCRFSDFVQSFWTFHSIHYGHTLEIMPKTLRLLAESPVPLPLPWSESSDPSAMVPRETDFTTPAHKLFLELLRPESERPGSLGQLVDIASLGSSYCPAIAEALECAGVIKARRSMGDSKIEAIGVNFSAVRYVPQIQMSTPSLEFNIVAGQTALARQSRLDLVMLLYRQGFIGTYDAPRYWDDSPSSQQVFRLQAMMSGTKLYFVALLLRHEIASRGGFVMHTGSTRYYKLLLSLKDFDALKCLKDARQAPLTDAQLQAIADKKSLNEPLLPLKDVEGADDDGNEGDASHDETAPPCITDALPLQLDKYAAESYQMRPYQYESEVGVAYVHFDNCSHSSGKLRAFVKCWAHEVCTKHIQVETAGNRHAAICYCVAWLHWQKSEQLAREDHSGKKPPDALVADFMTKIPQSA